MKNKKYEVASKDYAKLMIEQIRNELLVNDLKSMKFI